MQGKTIAVWGLSFKPNTDDMREAPSIVIIEKLLAAGAKVIAYDPEAMEEARKVFADRISYGKKSYEVIDRADALLIVTEWNEFRRPDLGRIKSLLKTPIIIDGRNLFEPGKMKALGFDYEGIGRM
jgi:UDPglucose 6-dehydrogenase